MGKITIPVINDGCERIFMIEIMEKEKREKPNDPWLVPTFVMLIAGAVTIICIILIRDAPLILQLVPLANFIITSTVIYLITDSRIKAGTIDD